MATPTLRTGAYVEFLKFNIGQKLGAVTGDLLFFNGEEITLLSPGAAGEVILSAGPGNPPTFGPAPMGAIPDPLALNRLNANEIGFNTGTDIKFKAPPTIDFAGSNLFWGNTSGLLSTGTNNTSLGQTALTALTTGTDNTGLGFNALGATTNGSNNVALGSNALSSNVTGSDNVALGSGALASATGSQNTAVGSGALSSIVAGSNLTAFGYNALASNNGGSDNTGVGSDVLSGLIVGINNTALGSTILNMADTSDNIGIGATVLTSATAGNDNIAIGNNLFTSGGETENAVIAHLGPAGGSRLTVLGFGAHESGDTGAFENVAIGYESLNSTVTGIETTAVGTRALTALTTGAGNTGIGFQAGSTIVGGSNNTIVGYNADVSAAVSNCVIIGSGASSTTDGSIVIGDGTVVTTDTINIGVGNTTTNASQGQVIGHISGAGIFSTTIGFLADPNGMSNQSVHIGFQSGRSITAANRNTAVGVGSLNQAPTPDNNVAIGDFTLSAAAVGNSNTAVGSQAGGNATATRSVWVGAYPVGGGQNGNDSVYVGYSAAIYSSAATIDSIYIGSSAGVTAGPGTPLTGPGNIVIGTRANVNTLATTESMVIGNDALGSNNSISIGNNTNAGSTSCVVIGEAATCTQINTVVIGQGASSVSPSDTVIGQGATSLVSNATVVGQGATAGIGSNQSTILGSTAISTGSNCAILGYGAVSTANNSVVVGSGSTSNSANSTVLGFSASSTAANGIAIGNGATATVADSCQIGPTVVSGGATLSFRTQTVSDEAWIGGGATSLIIDNNGNMNRAVDDLPVLGMVGTKYTFNTNGITPVVVQTFTVPNNTIRRIEVKCVGRGTIAPFINSVFSARSDALIKNNAGTITTHVTQEIQISDVLATIEYNIGVGEVAVRIIGIGGYIADWTAYIMTFTG